jgi:IS605 OrfB family transposase
MKMDITAIIKLSLNTEQTGTENIFTNFAVRQEGHHLKLSLSKKMQEKFRVKSLNLPFPHKVAEHVDFNSIQQVKLVWKHSANRWEVHIIHIRMEEKPDESFNNIMSIDLGLDNLCAITFKDSKELININGKTLKSKNSYFNKEMARLTSFSMLETGSNKFKRTKHMKRIQAKRNNTMKDGLHKASRAVVNLAKEHHCRTIVIGDIKGIKQKNPIKGFVQIPLHTLVQQIRYKAELAGIEVKLVTKNCQRSV